MELEKREGCDPTMYNAPGSRFHSEISTSCGSSCDDLSSWDGDSSPASGMGTHAAVKASKNEENEVPTVGIDDIDKVSPHKREVYIVGSDNDVAGLLSLTNRD